MRQYNDRKERNKRTINDLHNTTQKTTDRVTRTPLKTEGEFMCTGSVNSSCSTFGTRRVTLVTNPEKSHEFKKEQDCDYDKQKKKHQPCLKRKSKQS